MADDDVHAQATLKVGVEGQQGITNLTSAVQNLHKATTNLNNATKPAAVNAAGAAATAGAVAGVKAKGKQAEQEIEQQLTFGQRMLVRAISTMITAPITASIATFRFAGGALKEFAGAIAPALGKLPAGVLAVGGIGLAFTGLLIPVAKLIGGIKLLGVSFGWAQEQAENARNVAAQTRTLYPGLVGEAFGKAQDQVETRMATISAIFGEGAAGLSESIQKKFMDYRLSHLGGMQREMAEFFGLTVDQRAQFEKSTGRRTDLLDYLGQFVQLREKLQDDFNRAPEGEGKQRVASRMNYLTDFMMDAFGGQFTRQALTWHTSDVQRLRSQMAEARQLGRVPDDHRATDFDISLKSLLGTFDAIKHGIGGDVQPSITKFMDDLRHRLIDVDRNGNQLGKSLRTLGADMAGAAWRVLDSLLLRIDVDKVNRWIKEIGDWDTEKAADDIIKFGQSLWKFMKVVEKGVTIIAKLYDIANFLTDTSDQSAPKTPADVVKKAVRNALNPVGAANAILGNPLGRGASAVYDAVTGSPGGPGAPAAPDGTPASPSSLVLPGGGTRVPTTSVEQAATSAGAVGSDSTGIKGVVDRAAERYGLNPRVLYGIIAGESLHGNKYDSNQSGESSWSMFQLNRAGGLGNVFERETGKSVMDPSSIPAIADFAAKRIAADLRAGKTLAQAVAPWRGFRGLLPWDPGWGSMGYRGNDPTAPKAKASLLDSDNLATSNKAVTEAPASDGSAFGRTAAQSFLSEVRSVPVHIGVHSTSEGTSPWSAPPTGGDTPTE